MYIHIVRTLQACISGNVYMYTYTHICIYIFPQTGTTVGRPWGFLLGLYGITLVERDLPSPASMYSFRYQGTQGTYSMYKWQFAHVYVYTHMYIHIVRTLQACISGNVHMYTYTHICIYILYGPFKHV